MRSFLALAIGAWFLLSSTPTFPWGEGGHIRTWLKPRRHPSHVVHHVVALKRGGKDDPINMQSQAIQVAKIKDKTE